MMQVRYSPRGVLLKQAENAEALAAEIGESRVYPEDWLTYRVTGYAPDITSPRLIDGASLLADLSSLVENLTSLAKLTAGEPQAVGEAVEALMTRWRVTRRTLERYRRAGLVARRVVDDSVRGRARLVFTAGAVEAFERRRADFDASGGGLAGSQPHASPRPLDVEQRTKRLGAAERVEILALGRELLEAAGASLDARAAFIARRTGRARSTVRRVLERDEASPAVAGGVRFPTGGGRVTEREARLAHRAQRAGIAMPLIAGRLGRSVPTVHRLIVLARVEALTALLPVDGEHPDAQPPEAAGHPLLMLDADPCGVVEIMNPGGADAKPLSAHDERLVAMAHVNLVRRARSLLAGADHGSPRASVIDDAETALCQALRLKRQLLRSTLPLIRRTLQRHAEASGSDALLHDAAIHERCLEAASDAIDDFVPMGAGRLAARVSLALNRALTTKGSREQQRPARRAAPFGATPAHLTMPPWVRRGLPGLSDRERGLLVARFGSRNEPPRSLASLIESNPGLTPAAWWAMYRKAARLASRALSTENP